LNGNLKKKCEVELKRESQGATDHENPGKPLNLRKITKACKQENLLKIR
jgi:hypothetical protein